MHDHPPIPNAAMGGSGVQRIIIMQIIQSTPSTPAQGAVQQSSNPADSRSTSHHTRNSIVVGSAALGVHRQRASRAAMSTKKPSTQAAATATTTSTHVATCPAEESRDKRQTNEPSKDDTQWQYDDDEHQ
jgi:hypothetical protein